MSGVEALGLISSIISILDALGNIINAYHDNAGLPETMRDAQDRLPLIRYILSLVKESLEYSRTDKRKDTQEYRAMTRVLKGCEKKIMSLDRIFRNVLPLEGNGDGPTRASVRRRLTTATRMTLHMGKNRKVMSLMKEILEDIGLLANNHSIASSVRKQIKASTQAIQMQRSAPPDLDPNSALWKTTQPPSVMMDDRPSRQDSFDGHGGYDNSMHDDTNRRDQRQYARRPPPPLAQMSSSIYNHAGGTQNNFAGNGNQNINSGGGQFFVGSISSPLSFSTVAEC